MTRGTHAMTDNQPLPDAPQPDHRVSRHRSCRLALALVAVLALGWGSGILPRAWESGQQQRHQQDGLPAGSEHLPITTASPLSDLGIEAIQRQVALTQRPSSLEDSPEMAMARRLAAVHGRFGNATIAQTPPRAPATLATLPSVQNPRSTGSAALANEAPHSFGLIVAFSGTLGEDLRFFGIASGICCDGSLSAWLQLTMRLSRGLEVQSPDLRQAGPHSI